MSHKPTNDAATPEIETADKIVCSTVKNCPVAEPLPVRCHDVTIAAADEDHYVPAVTDPT